MSQRHDTMHSTMNLATHRGKMRLCCHPVARLELSAPGGSSFGGGTVRSFAQTQPIRKMPPPSNPDAGRLPVPRPSADAPIPPVSLPVAAVDLTNDSPVSPFRRKAHQVFGGGDALALSLLTQTSPAVTLLLEVVRQHFDTSEKSPASSASSTAKPKRNKTREDLKRVLRLIECGDVPLHELRLASCLTSLLPKEHQSDQQLLFQAIGAVFRKPEARQQLLLSRLYVSTCFAFAPAMSASTRELILKDILDEKLAPYWKGATLRDAVKLLRLLGVRQHVYLHRLSLLALRNLQPFEDTHHMIAFMEDLAEYPYDAYAEPRPLDAFLDMIATPQRIGRAPFSLEEALQLFEVLSGCEEITLTGVSRIPERLALLARYVDKGVRALLEEGLDDIPSSQSSPDLLSHAVSLTDVQSGASVSPRPAHRDPTTGCVSHPPKTRLLLLAKALETFARFPSLPWEGNWRCEVFKMLSDRSSPPTKAHWVAASSVPHLLLVSRTNPLSPHKPSSKSEPSVLEPSKVADDCDASIPCQKERWRHEMVRQCIEWMEEGGVGGAKGENAGIGHSVLDWAVGWADQWSVRLKGPAAVYAASRYLESQELVQRSLKLVNRELVSVIMAVKQSQRGWFSDSPASLGSIGGRSRPYSVDGLPQDVLDGGALESTPPQPAKQNHSHAYSAPLPSMNALLAALTAARILDSEKLTDNLHSVIRFCLTESTWEWQASPRRWFLFFCRMSDRTRDSLLTGEVCTALVATRFLTAGAALCRLAETSSTVAGNAVKAHTWLQTLQDTALLWARAGRVEAGWGAKGDGARRDSTRSTEPPASLHDAPPPACWDLQWFISAGAYSVIPASPQSDGGDSAEALGVIPPPYCSPFCYPYCFGNAMMNLPESLPIKASSPPTPPLSDRQKAIVQKMQDLFVQCNRFSPFVAYLEAGQESALRQRLPVGTRSWLTDKVKATWNRHSIAALSKRHASLGISSGGNGLGPRLWKSHPSNDSQRSTAELQSPLNPVGGSYEMSSPSKSSRLCIDDIRSIPVDTALDFGGGPSRQNRQSVLSSIWNDAGAKTARTASSSSGIPVKSRTTFWID